jgi:hypothetical protein
VRPERDKSGGKDLSILARPCTSRVLAIGLPEKPIVGGMGMFQQSTTADRSLRIIEKRVSAKIGTATMRLPDPNMRSLTASTAKTATFAPMQNTFKPLTP